MPLRVNNTLSYIPPAHADMSLMTDRNLASAGYIGSNRHGEAMLATDGGLLVSGSRCLPGQLQGSSELVVNVAMHAQKEHRVGGKCMEELCSVINTHDTVPVPVI